MTISTLVLLFFITEPYVVNVAIVFAILRSKEIMLPSSKTHENKNKHYEISLLYKFCSFRSFCSQLIIRNVGLCLKLYKTHTHIHGGR